MGGEFQNRPPCPPVFSQVLILNVDKVVCFDTLLQVLILKGLILHQNCAKCGFARQVFILKGFKVLRMNTSTSVDSREVAEGRHTYAAWGRRTTWRGHMIDGARPPAAGRLLL